MENNIVLIYPVCISKNLHIISFWELDKKGSKRRLTVNLKISQRVILRVSAEASVCYIHCVDADTDFNYRSCQEEWIGFLGTYPWASVLSCLVYKTETKGKWISLAPEFFSLEQRQRKRGYCFCYASVTLLNSPWEHRSFACIPDIEKLHANRVAWSCSELSAQTTRDAQVKLLQIKEILERVFGKIIVTIFHLDTFASKFLQILFLFYV